MKLREGSLTVRNVFFTLRPLSPVQELLAVPDLLAATLLRHMTAGLILSSALNAGPNPVVTGAGEEITVTKHPGRAFIAINSKLRWT